MRKYIGLSAAVAAGVFTANIATMGVSALVVEAALPEVAEKTYSATTSQGTRVVTGLAYDDCMVYISDLDGGTCMRD